MAPERPLAVLHHIVAILGSVFLATIPDDVTARTLPGLPEDTGYFDGSLWRLGLQPNGRSTLAFDDAGRLIVSGFTLGTSVWTFPSLARWDGRRWETLATNGGPIEVVLPPAGWYFPDPNPLRGCAWIGNDLYLAGDRATVSDAESLGLAIWHEPGVKRVLSTGDGGGPALRATGAVPARFAWEQGDRLRGWVPFTTNALGNPGWITVPNAGRKPGFLGSIRCPEYRIPTNARVCHGSPCRLKESRGTLRS